MEGIPGPVVRTFAAACRSGDLGAVRAVLAPGVVAMCDGRDPAHGADDVARLAVVVLGGPPGAALTLESVNGRPGLAARRAGRTVAVIAVETAGGAVTALWIVLDRAKLHHWDRP